MLNKNLRLWIAQSDSWHSFVNFDMPRSEMANYSFIKRPDDFYLALIGSLYEHLRNDVEEVDKNELFAIGKGLEIFSLENTRNNFYGVSHSINMLYVACIYYLADFSASSLLLARLFPAEVYKEEIDIFLSAFLRRDLGTDNKYFSFIKSFLQDGDKSKLKLLMLQLRKDCDQLIDRNPSAHLSYIIAEKVCCKFEQTNICNDLLNYNDFEFWKDYVEHSIHGVPPVLEFFPSQREAINRGILRADKTSFSLQMPTSGGKTFLCELIIYEHIRATAGGKVLFLAPFRALASQLRNSLGKRLKSLDIKTKTIYGGSTVTAEEREAIDKFDLLISTPEKLMALGNSFKEIIDRFTMVICDEGHLIDDGNRGLRYELLLSRFKKSTESHVRFVFLSAIIPNIEDINEWLGGSSKDVAFSNYRPTYLKYAFLKSIKSGQYYLDVNPTDKRPLNYQINNFINDKLFSYKNTETGREKKYSYSSKKSISAAVALKCVASGTVALFAPQKGKNGITGLVDEICNQLDHGLPFPNPRVYGDEEHIKNLAAYFLHLFGKEYLLTKIISHGVLYHHGDLPQNVREIIEQSLDSGRVKLVVCTNTLAEGVNLPIKNIVIHSTKRYENKKWCDLNARDLKNLVGRAGRAGKELEGLVIVPHESDFNNIIKVIENNNIEPVHGQLYNIIKEITRVVLANRLVIDNRLLEGQNEAFLKLLDSIDISIIDLLSEEIDIDELSAAVQNIIEQTFAYNQSKEEERIVLSDLVLARSEKIAPYIDNRSFIRLKKSGASIRMYEEIIAKIDLNDIRWKITEQSTTKEFVLFILENTLSIASVQISLQDFNSNNKTDYKLETISEIIHMWINGAWYYDISIRIGADVSSILKLFSSFISFTLVASISSIISVCDDYLSAEGFCVSGDVGRFSNYVNYGVNDPIKLHLSELGIRDRDSINLIARLLLVRKVDLTKRNAIFTFLKDNKTLIISILKESVTSIGYIQTREDLKFLGY